MRDLCQRLHVVPSSVTEREAWSRSCARSTRPCTNKKAQRRAVFFVHRPGGGKLRKDGRQRQRREGKGSGQRVGRGRAPPPLDNGAGHPATVRRRLVCLASVGICDCAPAHAAKARVRRHPHSAPPAAARRRHRHRPQASATGQATTTHSAATRPAPASSPATGEARAAPSSAAVVAVANRVARAVGALRAKCCHSAIKPEVTPVVGTQVEDKTSGSLQWKTQPSEVGDRRGSVARGGGQFQTRSWSSAASISIRAVG